MRKGKVAVFTKPGVPIELREETCPDPEPGEIIVRVDMAGVCGSDVHRLFGRRAWRRHAYMFRP